jgi:hypothetical protein
MMTETEVDKLASREPFQPYRLVLAEGEEVLVTQPRKAVVSGGYIMLAGTTRRPKVAARHGLRFIRVDQIVSVEPVDEAGGRSNGRNK